MSVNIPMETMISIRGGMEGIGVSRWPWTVLLCLSGEKQIGELLYQVIQTNSFYSLVGAQLTIERVT